MNSRIRRILLDRNNAQLLNLLASGGGSQSAYDYLHNLARLDYLRHAGKARRRKPVHSS